MIGQGDIARARQLMTDAFPKLLEDQPELEVGDQSLQWGESKEGREQGHPSLITTFITAMLHSSEPQEIHERNQSVVW